MLMLSLEEIGKLEISGGINKRTVYELIGIGIGALALPIIAYVSYNSGYNKSMNTLTPENIQKKCYKEGYNEGYKEGKKDLKEFYQRKLKSEIDHIRDIGTHLGISINNDIA